MTRRIAMLCTALLFAAAVFGAEQKERTRPDQPFTREAAKQREAAPLLYALPTLRTNDISILELRVLQGKVQLIRERVMLPAEVPDGAAVDVLFTHPDELRRLRAIETETPGKLRFIALIDGRVVTDEPFASIEAQGRTLSLDAAIGEVQEIESRPTPKPRVRSTDKDPACVEHCDWALSSCLEWCDPRGDCSFCYTQYDDCASPCPDLPVPCTEPKSTSTYSTTTYDSGYPYGTGCFVGKQWTHWANRFLVSDYTRTEHCDGSYTDSFNGSHYIYNDCWVNDGYFCYGGFSAPPGNRC
ncbi:MAG TPA: hypothetical protein VJ276_12470 [Thermoanaerobaculia bacterium]|nr:hypothetical protein [Thermoanaerobaculia bacterium]